MESEVCRICFASEFVDVGLFESYKTEYNIVEIIFELTSLQVECLFVFTFNQHFIVRDFT